MVIISGLLSPLYAFALTVNPPRLELAVEPGRAIDGIINVTGDFGQGRAARIRVYLSDWNLKPDGDVSYSLPGKLPRSLCRWLSVAPAEFILPRDHSQAVHYRLKPPEDITGSYWGTLMVEYLPDTTSPQGGNRGVGVSIGARVAVIIYATAQRGAIRDGRISNVKAEWEESNLAMSATFDNLGNTVVRLKGRFELRDPVNNRVLAKAPFEEIPVLPGGSREIADTWTGALKPGSYLLVALIDYGGKNIVAGQRILKVSQG